MSHRTPATPDATPSRPSSVLFTSELVKVGKFRCPASHPQFADSGPTREYCFVFPRTAVWIQHDGSEAFVADSTVVPLYNPGLPYRRRQISPAGDRTDWFGVAPGALREMLDARDRRASDAEHRLFRFDFARAGTSTFLAQRRIFDRCRMREAPDALYVEESVLALLDEVLAGVYERVGPPDRLSTRQRAIAEDARALLNRTYAGRATLTEIASAVGASPFHLCRVFKQHTGQTIHAYRGQLRLRRSLDLLGDTRDDLLQIGVAIGYSGHSHFTAAFHRAFGLTPSQFRARLHGRRAVPALPAAPRADLRTRLR